MGIMILVTLADWDIIRRKRFKAPIERNDLESEDRDETNG